MDDEKFEYFTYRKVKTDLSSSVNSCLFYKASEDKFTRYPVI